MLALEKPHWGVSGVPFMNSTTGADATALSIACRVSADRNLRAMGEMMRGRIWRRVMMVLVEQLVGMPVQDLD